MNNNHLSLCCNNIKNFLNNINTNLINILIKNKVYISGTFISYIISPQLKCKFNDIDLYCENPLELIKDLDNLNIHYNVYRYNNTINYSIKIPNNIIVLQIIYAKITSLEFLNNFDINLTKVAYVCHENYIHLSNDFINSYNIKEFYASKCMCDKRFKKYLFFTKYNYKSILLRKDFENDFRINYYTYKNKYNYKNDTKGTILTYSMKLLNMDIKRSHFNGCIMSKCNNKTVTYLCDVCIASLKLDIYIDNTIYNKNFMVIGAASSYGSLIFNHIKNNASNNYLGTSYWYESNDIINYDLRYKPDELILSKLLESDIIFLAATKTTDSNKIYLYKNIIDYDIDEELLNNRYQVNVLGYIKLLKTYMHYKIDSNNDKKQLIVYIDNNMSSFNDEISHPELNIIKTAQKRVVYQFLKIYNNININFLIYNIYDENIDNDISILMLMNNVAEIYKNENKVNKEIDVLDSLYKYKK